MSEPAGRRAGRARAGGPAWAVWLAAALAAGVAWWWMRGPAFAAAAAAPSACALRRTFGIACPTCGMTRAFARLVHGDWRAALALHPWAPLLVAQLAALWVAWGAWLAGALRERPDRWVPLAVALNAAALALLWVARLATGTLPA